jgi:hypothetical protein
MTYDTPLSTARRRLRVLAGFAAAMSLAACALNPPKPPPPEPLPPPPIPVVEVEPPPPPPPPDEVGPLLNYHQSLRRMTQGDLVKELSGLGLQQRSPRVAVQMGMVLMLTRGAGDLARAQALLDSVATSADSEAAPFKPLAQMLSSNCAETRRLSEHADKLVLQQKDSQRRIDQLNEMLEGLKTIERTLPARPAVGPQAVIK